MPSSSSARGPAQRELLGSAECGHRACRGVRRQTFRQQARREGPGGAAAHVDEQGRLRVGEANPVEVSRQIAVLTMAGDEADRMSQVAVGQRDAKRWRPVPARP